MKRNNLILCAVFSVAVGATQAGCCYVPPKAESPVKVYQTPEEAFRAFMAAGEKEDWKTACECLTDETRDKLAAGLIFGGMLATGSARTEEEKAKLKPIEDVLAKHGLTKTGKAPAGPKVDLEQGIMRLVASIEDRSAFIAEFLAALKQASDDPTKNPLAGDVKLEDVKVQGDSATGIAVAKVDGREARQPLNFKKVGGGWRIEIPERARPGKDVPPSDAEKVVIERVKKLGGRVERDRELPGQPVTLVSLAVTKATDDDVKVLAALPQLREVHLNGTQISDAAVKTLAPLKQLRVLNVMATSVTDAGLAELGAFPALEKLWLSSTGVTDEGLKHLARLPELREVWLATTKVTDAGLQELAKLPKLRNLELRDSRVTDAGLKALAGLQGLETLFLSELPLTDAGLNHLTGL
jgi:hypothetical protein